MHRFPRNQHPLPLVLSLQCALCRNPITDLKEAELDHRVPLSKGGSDDPSNLQLAHRECNRTKGAKLE